MPLAWAIGRDVYPSICNKTKLLRTMIEVNTSDEEQSQELLTRADSNMVEDSCEDDGVSASREDGRGYQTHPHLNQKDAVHGSGYRFVLPGGVASSSTRTVIPETYPCNYDYAPIYEIDNAPIHRSYFVSPAEKKRNAVVHEDDDGSDDVETVNGGGGRTYGSELNRHVEFYMTDDDIAHFITKDYPFVLRLHKIGSKVHKNISFNKSVLLKGRTNTVFRDEFELSTDMPGDLFETVKSRINMFLADVQKGAKAEELYDTQNMCVYVKSLKQTDLLNIRTDIERLPNNATKEAGGTKQTLIPVQNANDLITALNLIAFRDSVREHQQTQSTHLSCFVLDVFIKVRNSCQASARLPVTASQPAISSHFSASKDDDEVSTITASIGTSRGRKRPASPLNSEVSLNVYLIAPTWKGKANSGVEKPMVYDKTILGEILEIPASESPAGTGVRIGMVYADACRKGDARACISR